MHYITLISYLPSLYLFQPAVNLTTHTTHTTNNTKLSAISSVHISQYTTHSSLSYIQSLDPYTEFENLGAAKNMLESVSGKYGGVGLIISGSKGDYVFCFIVLILFYERCMHYFNSECE